MAKVAPSYHRVHKGSTSKSPLFISLRLYATRYVEVTNFFDEEVVLQVICQVLLEEHRRERAEA